MKKKAGKAGNRLPAAVMAVALGIVMAAGQAMTAMALETGTYLVTVKPSYRNPATGAIDDPGNNEAIGQGMTERMCGSTGLLEVDDSGRMHLTVRYYLSQFIKNVSFEEDMQGSFTALPHEEMQTRAAVEGASDLEEKYGYTDYRIPINSMDSVFRGKAYIDAMGRDVVYFFTFSDPVQGSGDFKVSASRTWDPAAPETQGAETQGGTAEPDEASYAEAAAEEGGESREAEASGGNGSGRRDDPVTGIPEKPSGQTSSGVSSLPAEQEPDGQGEDFSLDTRYDLSAVPVKEARKLVDPMLEKATGITGSTYKRDIGTSASSMGTKDEGSNGNRTVMIALLAAAFLLLLQYAVSALRRDGGKKASLGRYPENVGKSERGGRA
ncbi:heme-binding Shp domain-containing protein [Clostridium sp. Marseille-P2415]|uniref:heme-binding Shp domain-containing protein n=1 Tax=Clostridium sp. Marseille-P2415 TaxID=1805471 RepID=UPI000988818C|nr:heme-binding Shp domain-containing protein [Clostridium sp. Marseille-P2415]